MYYNINQLIDDVHVCIHYGEIKTKEVKSTHLLGVFKVWLGISDALPCLLSGPEN